MARYGGVVIAIQRRPLSSAQRTLTMDLTVTKMKSMPGLDGLAWSATLCLDGKPVATCHDEGNGGGLDWNWTLGDTRYENGPLATKVRAYAKSLPPITLDGTTFPCDLDSLVAQLADEAQAAARRKRLCAKKTVGRLPGDAPGTWSVWPVPFTPALKARLVAAHPGIVFANEGAT